MDNEKVPKTKRKFNFIIIYVIGFIISIFFEFYWISYYPYDYFMLFGIGIILCIFGYLSIDSVLDMIYKTTQKRDEQNEIMIKASKAIYLTTKKLALDNARSEKGSPALSSRSTNINSLVDDLAQANERLAKEIENAMSIRSLVNDNRKIVENVQAAMMQPSAAISPLDLEREMKLDETVGPTDFETITPSGNIDALMNMDVAASEIQQGDTEQTETVGENLTETIMAVNEIMDELPSETDSVKESPSAAAESLSETAMAVNEIMDELPSDSDSVKENLSEIAMTVNEIMTETSTTPETTSADSISAQPETAAANTVPDQPETAAADTASDQPEIPSAGTASAQPETAAADTASDQPEIPSAGTTPDQPETAAADTAFTQPETANSEENKQLTPDEIASLFANL